MIKQRKNRVYHIFYIKDIDEIENNLWQFSDAKQTIWNYDENILDKKELIQKYFN